MRFIDAKARYDEPIGLKFKHWEICQYEPPVTSWFLALSLKWGLKIEELKVWHSA